MLIISVLDVFRKNAFTSKASDAEIETQVKRWFKLAGDRDGGRKEREGKKKLTAGRNGVSNNNSTSDVGN